MNSGKIPHIHWGQYNISNGEGTLFAGEVSIPLKELPVAVYRHFDISYAKFFKMDMLSKVAFLASELLLKEAGDINDLDKEKIAVVMATHYGCLEVDKSFEDSRSTLASPALFVYTLPNIMLGEICIRNGFKGEQLCLIAENAADAFLKFTVDDLLESRGMEACLYGFADATAEVIQADLFFRKK